MNYFSIKVLSTVMKQGEDKTSRMYYASSALTYLLAMVCSNMALQWVNYPTQVIIKKHPKYYLQLCAVVLMVSFTICICAYMISHTGGWKVVQANSCYDPWSFIWEQIISYG